MRLPVVVNPETWNTWRSNYRSRMTLLLIVWLISPNTRLEATADQPRHTSSSVHNIHQSSPLLQRVITGSGLSDPATPTAQLTVLAQLPLTPPYPSLHSKTEPSVHVSVPSQPPTRPSTTFHSDPSTALLPPLPLSSAPAVTDVDESACPIDYRGRRMCPGQPLPRHPSFTERRSELADACQAFALWLLAALRPRDVVQSCGSFGVFVFVFHLLLCIQLGSLVIEDQIVKTNMSDPMPPSFAPAPKRPASVKATDWTKRWAHARWRSSALAKRHWPALVSLIALGAIAGWLMYEAIARGASLPGRVPDWGSWDDVPLGRWILEDVSGGERITKRKRGGPLRVLILLEAAVTCLSLLQPIKHLLPHSILPSTLPAPQWLFPSDSNGVRETCPSPSLLPNLCTPHLLQQCHDLILSGVALLELAVVVASLPSYSPLTLPPHLIFHATRHHARRAVATRDAVVRTRDRLAFVFAKFPLVRHHGSPSAAEGRVSEEDSRVEEDGTWVCTICFEGVDLAATSSTTAVEGVPSSGSETILCQLPCGHRYHGECLTTWLHHQSFCPICHRDIQDDASNSRHGSAARAHPVRAVQAPPPAPPEADMTDVYPGADARRRRIASRMIAGES